MNHISNLMDIFQVDLRVHILQDSLEGEGEFVRYSVGWAVDAHSDGRNVAITAVFQFPFTVSCGASYHRD